jgi:metallo-beta-lactamase class B
LALFVCGLSIPGYPLRDQPPYPGIVPDYQASIRRLRGLPCDVFLEPHGSRFRLLAKAEQDRAGGRSPFIDPHGCRVYLEQAARTLEDQLRP